MVVQREKVQRERAMMVTGFGVMAMVAKPSPAQKFDQRQIFLM